MLIKVVLFCAAAIGTMAVVIVHEKEPAPAPAPAVLRQATPAETRLLDSMTTVAPKPQGGMH
jgi:hypothetical protein